MIRLCEKAEFERIYAVINDGARAYKGVIPEGCWTDPYMSESELQEEINRGVVFWCCEENGRIIGVMGLEDVEDVTLIRHAYVVTASQRQGIGRRLLSRLQSRSRKPILIGTWADAIWAIRFYEKNGFQMVGLDEGEWLLKRYWRVPQRQIDTSVVLADARWHQANSPDRPMD
jgi:N-acetylglutamate synthase-like GNAT family acetyltransferase